MQLEHDGPLAIPLWINGRACLTVGERLFDVVNPVTGVATHRVPLCAAEEAAQAVSAARAAAAAWSDLGLRGRQEKLAQLAEALARYRGHFAKMLQSERGMDEAEAEAEVSAALEALASTSVGEAGVLGLVTGAEHSLRAAAMAAPALLAGATLVIKPSPKAPSAAFALAELASRCDIPAGVLNVLHGDGPAIEGLCTAGVDALLFAGEEALQVQVAALVAQHGTPFVALT
ncbi:aldehyde dehydrogenase family protein [Azonexus sp.]|uniref:aldehyde dehydrogenase family protein n=1 Tax=Azonexus sp. TaxID=1872668 RepID=UPI0039E4781D